jgi:predicted porin
MKKTLVALSVLMAASSAQAIEIYNQDKVSVSLAGDIEVVYVKGTDDGSEFEQEIQDADFGFDVRYQVNDNLQFGGYWEFDGASSDVTDGKDTYAQSGDAYVAFYTTNGGSIKFGRTCGALDDAGVGADYQFGVTSFFNNDSDFCADEMVRYDYDNGSFYATAALAQDKKNVDSLGEDGFYYDLKLGGRVAGFEITGYYGSAELENRIDSDTNAALPNQDDTLLALELRFGQVENLNIELGYYDIEADTEGASKVDSSSIALGVDYTIDMVTVAGGYSITDSDNAASEVDSWFVNAGWGFAPNTTAYVEIGGNDADNSETGVAVGVKASF